MEKTYEISKDYLYIPVQTEGEESLIEIFSIKKDGTLLKEFEFSIPIIKNKEESNVIDYFARFPVKKFTDKNILLRGEVPEVFMKEVFQDSFLDYETLERPSIHFTPQRSWMNDPNGLIYKDGFFHLYYQYNPFHIKWNNMSWGHAMSKDLLHWVEMDMVLFPDQDGMMFSGSAISNQQKCFDLSEEAIIFFYTAAGGTTNWSKNKESIQKIAYSLDQGKTLNKLETTLINTIETENRDPKVFWHQESKGYIMCLWLDKNEFAILRSENLSDFVITQRFELADAWECPDLFQIKGEKGESKWVFWTADGFYYFGEFNGFQFESDGIQHKAYMNKIPYAAQTYSGVSDRIISISWLRLEFSNRLYTGAMGIPREFKLIEFEGIQKISQQYTKELLDQMNRIDFSMETKHTEIVEIEIKGPTLLNLYKKTDCSNNKDKKCNLVEGEILIQDISGIQVKYNSDSGVFSIGKEEFLIGNKINDFSILIDDVICEVTAKHGIIVGVFELEYCPNRIQFHQGEYQLEQMYCIS